MQTILNEARAKYLAEFDRQPGATVIGSFFEKLSAETAREFRVQRGYDSDSEQAAEQAAFIENLKCDVVALALKVYMKQFPWLLNIRADMEKRRDAGELAAIAHRDQPKVVPWQQRLYFLLYLVPVGEVSSLLHQLRKWNVLEAKAASKDEDETGLFSQCAAAMGLYLDMHDARFDGGSGLKVPDSIKACFESEQDFNDLYQQAKERDYQAARGLREMQRFGNFAILKPFFQKNLVTRQQVADWKAREKKEGSSESQIAQAQDEVQRIHEKWVKNKKTLSEAECEQYQKDLNVVIEHRCLAGQVRFTNHLRLHRLMMAVLARLVDYAGLWERDLYFVALALTHRQGRTPNKVFPTEKSREKFQDGQVVRALGDAQGLDEMKKYFGESYLGGKKSPKNQTPAAIRNALSHFNMLQKPGGAALNLTEWVNRCRTLVDYDRKLKNAVSKSVLELLLREGLELRWEMREHHLENAQVKSKVIKHLAVRAPRKNSTAATTWAWLQPCSAAQFVKKRRKSRLDPPRKPHFFTPGYALFPCPARQRL